VREICVWSNCQFQSLSTFVPLFCLEKIIIKMPISSGYFRAFMNILVVFSVFFFIKKNYKLFYKTFDIQMVLNYNLSYHCIAMRISWLMSMIDWFIYFIALNWTLLTWCVVTRSMVVALVGGFLNICCISCVCLFVMILVVKGLTKLISNSLYIF
jgi:hypothetical protein